MMNYMKELNFIMQLIKLIKTIKIQENKINKINVNVDAKNIKDKTLVLIKISNIYNI